MFSLKHWKIKRLIKKIKAMRLNRVHNQPSDDVLKKEIAYYFELAQFFKKFKGDKHFPYPQILLVESYRAAAELDDAEAHFQLGQLFVSEAKYRLQVDSEGGFNSPENVKRSEQLLKEAHIHLQAAEKLGHIKAKRLRGLCYINGWGVTTDKNAGLELVIASIDEENSWDKVPQIFAEIGLNKPEFFTAILQRRKSLGT